MANDGHDSVLGTQTLTIRASSTQPLESSDYVTEESSARAEGSAAVTSAQSHSARTLRRWGELDPPIPRRSQQHPAQSEEVTDPKHRLSHILN